MASVGGSEVDDAREARDPIECVAPTMVAMTTRAKGRTRGESHGWLCGTCEGAAQAGARLFRGHPPETGVRTSGRHVQAYPRCQQPRTRHGERAGGISRPPARSLRSSMLALSGSTFCDRAQDPSVPAGGQRLGRSEIPGGKTGEKPWGRRPGTSNRIGLLPLPPSPTFRPGSASGQPMRVTIAEHSNVRSLTGRIVCRVLRRSSNRGCLPLSSIPQVSTTGHCARYSSLVVVTARPGRPRSSCVCDRQASSTTAPSWGHRSCVTTR